MINRKFLIVLVVVLVPLVLVVLRFGPGKWNNSSLVVGPKTTVIEGPLLPSGRPDYIAALNADLSEGVTPANNAAVSILQASGPKEIAPELRAKFFAGLQIPPMSEGGEYFVSWTDYARRLPKEDWPKPPADSDLDAESYLIGLFEAATEGPWRRDELPLVAKWLEANEGPMERMVEASTRPRFFAPRVASGNPPMLITVLLPLAQAAREPAQALSARAMLRLREKEYQAAWDDLMALRRLGRVMANEATLVEMLVGYAIEGLGVAGQVEFLAEAELTANEWAALAQELETLPSRARVADTLNRSERFMVLDAILGVAEGGAGTLSGLGNGNLDNPLTNLALRGVDWNIPLEIANGWMDRFVDVAKIEDPKQRELAADALEADLKAMVGDTKDPWGLAGAIASSRRASEKVGQIMVALMMPALRAVGQAEDRTKTYDTLVVVGIALARFKAEHGEYPEKLEQLVPGVLAAVPKDSFAGTPFMYTKRGEGYLLYSLGANQKDDGGKGYQEQGDDLAIEVPRPTRPPASEQRDLPDRDEADSPPAESPPTDSGA